MDVKEYKKYHEGYMMHNTGTSLEECALLLSTVPFCIFWSLYLNSNTSGFFSFVFEFLLIILTVILNCTILSSLNHVVFLNVVLLSTTLIIVKSDTSNFRKSCSRECRGKKSFISNYRASTNFISAICILAVDFTVFPTRLAKTETFGFGFMDLGVGCFICSNGFVERHPGGHYQFKKFLKTILVLCALGFIRLFSVKSIDYHEHVSEYGVHWNFFFTLALCRLLSYLLKLLTNDANQVYLSLIIGSLHQLLLLAGFQQWVLGDEPRNSFISANREGLVSCLGYISLYFAASAIGQYITEDTTYKNVLIKLFLMCIVTWVGTIFSINNIGVSRRLCNVGYIFWILALSLTELILFVILEISLISIEEGRGSKLFPTEPIILRSINAYGLFFFISSNLLTGLVNMVFQTLLLGKTTSMVMIVSYMIFLCTVTYTLYLKRLIYNYEESN